MNAKIRTIGLWVAVLGLIVTRESWCQEPPRRDAAVPRATEERPVVATPSSPPARTSGTLIRGPEVQPRAGGMGGYGGEGGMMGGGYGGMRGGGYGGEGGYGGMGGMGGYGGGRAGMGMMGMGMRGKPTYLQRIANLKSMLGSDETSDEEKAKAKQEIEALLNKYFDEDIETRQAKIAEIEQRVAKLKEHLQKRLTAKSELIQLQMKLIENEAAGLGFFEAPKAKNRGMYGGGGMRGAAEGMPGSEIQSTPR